MRRLHEHFVDGDEVSLGEALEDLQQLTERLRRDCPWDREQTARTIVPHTVEEAYEVADAANTGDDAKLADELRELKEALADSGDVAAETEPPAHVVEEVG